MILLGSGQILKLSTTDTYTLKDNEVAVNDVIYRKDDLEVTLSQTGDIDEKEVKVGIRLRKARKNIGAYFDTYDKWFINGVQQTSLQSCVENINTELYV